MQGRPTSDDTSASPSIDLSGGDGSAQSFVGLLALNLWSDPAGPRGSSRLRPSMLIPGTRRPRLGVLATMVDMIGGLLPNGFTNPTVDLRVTVVDEMPSEGVIDMATTTVKHGRRFLVSETLLSCEGRTFVRGTTTFLGDTVEDMTLYRSDPEPTVDIESFDAFMGATPVDAMTLELMPRPGLNNGWRPTIQGGVQATFAELVAEHALGGSAEVVDIEMRYLRTMKAGPLHGRAQLLGTHRGLATVRVLLTDAGADDRVVSYAAVSAVVG